jgi:hypothetical protein
MRDVIDGGNGVMVWAMPELQSLGASPNGIGRSVADLKVIYGPRPKGRDAEDDCQESRKNKEEDDTEHICGDVARLKGTGREVGLITNSVKAEDAEQEQGSEFAGQVDFRFMCEDWNDEDEKNNGRWSSLKYDWRLERMKNFLSDLGDGKPGQRKEVVIVSHGSFLREFVDDGKLSDIIRINKMLTFVSISTLESGRA